MHTLLFSVLAACLIASAVLALWWPRHGLFAWRRRRRAEARQILHEDVLKHLCKTTADGRRPTVESVSGVLRMHPDQTATLLQDLERQGMVTFSSGQLELTPAGRKAGLHVIRAHRLWECYLADETGLREREWHPRAEQREHRMTPEEADALAERLGNPTHDPHGDPIPTSAGIMDAATGNPLASLHPGESARLSHIEDEPTPWYRQLAAKGLRPGMTIHLLEKSAHSVRFTADGDEIELDPILAQQLEVRPLPPEAEAAQTLAMFTPGQRVTVHGLSHSCRGHERRRLLDLGFVKGSTVEVAMTSPSGEPTAYRVRGTLIALHREQARLVLVHPETAAA